MIDHDGLLKELLTTFFKEFLELFAPEVLQYADIESLTLASTESFQDAHEGGKRRADLLVQARWVHGSSAYFYIHVEIQSQTQAEFARRMYHDHARLDEMHNAPVYPIAVLAFDERNRDEPNTYTVSFPDRNVVRFEFLQIYLRKLNWRDFINRPNPVAAALMAKMGYARHERPLVKAECLRLLATLKLDKEKTRLIGRFVEAYLQLDEAEMTEYNEIMEAMPVEEKQAVTEILTYWEKLGLEQGLEKGLEQGRREGRREGMQRMVKTTIEARFGPMSAEDDRLLKALTEEKLEALGLTVVHAESYDEVRRVLLSGNRLQ